MSIVANNLCLPIDELRQCQSRAKIIYKVRNELMNAAFNNTML